MSAEIAVSGAEAAPPVAQPQIYEHRFQFTGSAGEYFRIWIVNVLLSVLTLGIYSAWAKVRTRQFFYRHTFLDGASFDYTADPVKILKGRLIAAAVFGSLALFQQFSVELYLVGLLLLLAATPWVIVRALAFNARNSTWRNVRFSFSGTARKAFTEYARGLIISIGTLGFASGVLQWRITRFAAEHHAFGKLPFRFTRRPMEYVLTYWLIAMFFALAAIFIGVFSEAAAEATEGNIVPSILLYLAFIAYGMTFVFMKVALANLAWGGIRIGEHRLLSDQTTFSYLWLQIVNVVAIACTLGLAAPWAKVRNHRYFLDHLKVHAMGALVVESDPSSGDESATGDAMSDLGDFDLGFG